MVMAALWRIFIMEKQPEKSFGAFQAAFGFNV